MTEAQQGNDSGQQANGSEGDQQQQQQATQTKQQAPKPTWWNPEWDGLPEAAQEAIRAASREAGSEAAKARKRAQAAEAKVQEFEQANLSESEKLQQQLKQLEQERDQAVKAAQSTAVKAEVTAVATQLGFRNPKVAHKLLDLDSVEYDKAGEPQNVEKLLKEVLQSDPYLAARGGADGGQGRETTKDESMSDRIRAAAGRR